MNRKLFPRLAGALAGLVFVLFLLLVQMVHGVPWIDFARRMLGLER